MSTTSSGMEVLRGSEGEPLYRRPMDKHTPSFIKSYDRIVEELRQMDLSGREHLLNLITNKFCHVRGKLDEEHLGPYAGRRAGAFDAYYSLFCFRLTKDQLREELLRLATVGHIGTQMDIAIWIWDQQDFGDRPEGAMTTDEQKRVKQLRGEARRQKRNDTSPYR